MMIVITTSNTIFRFPDIFGTTIIFVFHDCYYEYFIVVVNICISITFPLSRVCFELLLPSIFIVLVIIIAIIVSIIGFINLLIYCFCCFFFFACSVFFRTNNSYLHIKACVRYFLSNFYFISSNDSPSQTMKDVFYFI